MPTKAQREQRLSERNRELEEAQAARLHLERLLRSARIAIQMTGDDVKRNLKPLTLCEETGSELAERFEHGLRRARERLETIWKALNEGREVDTSAFLWRSMLTENERFAALVQQEPASHDALAQEEGTL